MSVQPEVVTDTPPRRRRKGAQNPLVGRNPLNPYLFSGPAVLIVGMVLAFPVLYGLYRSLFRIETLVPGRPFVGFENYAELFSTPLFWSSLGRSLMFIGGCIVIGEILGITFAFALNRATRGLRFLRGLSIVPYIVSSIAAAVLFRMLFNREFGLPSQVMTVLGMEPIGWLSDPFRAMIAVIVTQVWTDLPLALLVILGGLQTIDPSHLDAASVDGATGWQRMRHVSLPLIAPQIALSAVFLSYHALTSLGVILGLTGGGPGRATEVLSVMMYDVGFTELNQGMALAIMMVVFLLNGVLTLFYVWAGRGQGQE